MLAEQGASLIVDAQVQDSVGHAGMVHSGGGAHRQQQGG